MRRFGRDTRPAERSLHANWISAMLPPTPLFFSGRQGGWMAQATFSPSTATPSKDEIPLLQHPFRTFFRFARYLLPYWDKVVYILLGVFIAVPMAQMRLLIDKKIFDDVLVNEIATGIGACHRP